MRLRIKIETVKNYTKKFLSVKNSFVDSDMKTNQVKAVHAACGDTILITFYLNF